MSDKKREKSGVDGNEEFVWGRPGRRSAAERRGAVMTLLTGTASVDQAAKHCGVLLSTAEGWRDAAHGAVERLESVLAPGPRGRDFSPAPLRRWKISATTEAGGTMNHQDPTPGEPYEAPLLGQAVALERVTLFSGTINPDAGVINFGDG